ncbi:MAG TPA: cupin domain-containing protein [Pyrinomonadaceae bacterium]|nr:cupin domain-containing protein [Pyrinomonadaceae bacterium]
MKQIVMILALAVSVVTIANGQSTNAPPDHGLFGWEDVKWVEGPASLPRGAKVALLEGNPTQEGPFTMRLQLPDGFTIQPHWHPAVERVTVISGTFNLGMGEKFDKSAGRALAGGSFAFMPPGMKHYAWASGETVVQVHGMGPWKINYVNPADDPRTKK